MKGRPGIVTLAAVLSLGMALVGCADEESAEIPAADGYIEGQVVSDAGPEAGVWVIAETTDFSTTFRKIVVTNDDGQFVLPDLPDADYEVWVRGYGLLDSEPVQSRPGSTLALTATVAPTPQQAAEVYPANYWYSLITPPAPEEFPGTGATGNGIDPSITSQAQWMDRQNQGCMLCHQLGTPPTKDVSAHGVDMPNTAAEYRVALSRGQRGAQMISTASRFGPRLFDMLGDWSDRIEDGALPPQPERPQGIERNVVLTQWDWINTHDYGHDHTSTDKRDPTFNANGRIYAVNISNDSIQWVDPVTHEIGSIYLPTRDAKSTMSPIIPPEVGTPSRFVGDSIVWSPYANPHNPMMDHMGRVWVTTYIRDRETPDWCREGSGNQFAEYFSRERSGRGTGYYDPTADEVTLIDLCVGTHHLQFGEDADNTLWFSDPGGQAIGWVNTRVWDETGDEQAAHGWCPIVVDSNGDGQITRPWNEPNAGTGEGSAFDPSLDTRFAMAGYGVVPDPTDPQAVWIGETQWPGYVARLHVGDNPPESCISEVYQVPSVLDPSVPAEETGFGPRGIDIDRNGVVWTALTSGHFASLDRSKRTVTNGPEVADAQHCVDCWTLYPSPGPRIPGTVPSVTADMHYTNWVDQFNALGLGENVPITNGTNSDALLVLLPETGEWIEMRVPYPMGFYSRGLDGRIDDPDAGWKGRGVWGSYNGSTNWHIETGRPAIVKFQIRPDPLAR